MAGINVARALPVSAFHRKNASTSRKYGHVPCDFLQIFLDSLKSSHTGYALSRSAKGASRLHGSSWERIKSSLSCAGRWTVRDRESRAGKVSLRTKDSRVSISHERLLQREAKKGRCCVGDVEGHAPACVEGGMQMQELQENPANLILNNTPNLAAMLHSDGQVCRYLNLTLLRYSTFSLVASALSSTRFGTVMLSPEFFDKPSQIY